MSTRESLWTRVSSFWRAPHGLALGGNRNGGGNGHGLQPRAAAAAVVDDSAIVGVSGGAAAVSESRAGSSLLRGWRNPLNEKRDAFTRVADLMDAMQKHFERQDARAQQLTQSVERVAGILEELADAQRGQGDTLRSIAVQAEVAGRHNAAVAETMQRMPESLLAQAEALRTVARRIEMGQESEGQMVHSLQRFGGAVDSLRAAGLAQVETLQNLHAAERAQRDALTVLVRDQGRRFLVLMIVAGVMSIGALAALGLTVAFLVGN